MMKGFGGFGPVFMLRCINHLCVHEKEPASTFVFAN